MPIPTPQERDEEFVRELEHFIATGDVSRIPLTGFDQNGKWIGMKQFTDGENFPRKLTKKISKLKVPEHILITTDADGNKRLHGSYIVDTEDPLTIDFSRIDGNLAVRSTTYPDFHAPNLTEVEGRIEIMSANVNMPNLLCVASYLILDETRKLNIPKFAYAFRSLICLDVEEFNAPELLVTWGDILVLNATTVHVPKLTGVARHFLAGNATTFIAPNLQSVGGRLDTSSARNFYVASLEVGEWLAHPDAKRLFAARGLKAPHNELLL
jgi:hypothetical protein